ncbi:MAG: Lrp/AsnC family transcriptional regulator [Nanoarchaeota archaeon]|nr:Lrp/AsnC family transcriptional regulator [Nanoarchaeota archaeon]
MEKDDALIISHLRQNARKNLTSISKQTGIPVSTIFDRIKRYNGQMIIKHTALLDFAKLGFDMRVTIVLKVPKETRQEVQNYLMKVEHVNSMFRINNGYDFLVDALFRNMKEVNDLMEELDQFKVKKECYYVLEDLKREAFMSDPLIVKALY